MPDTDIHYYALAQTFNCAIGCHPAAFCDCLAYGSPFKPSTMDSTLTLYLVPYIILMVMLEHESKFGAF